MAKKRISADEWESGNATSTNAEKATAVLKGLATLAKGEAVSMSAIKELSGLKWPYSTVKALVKSGAVEQKKIGKALYYRARK